MSPILLWFLFSFDKIISVTQTLTILSILYIITICIIWLIGGCCSADGAINESKKFWEFSDGLYRHTKSYTILVITILSVSIAIKMFLPNAKEAIVITVYPQAMKIPDNILKMSNAYMEKKIKDWTENIEMSKITDSLPNKISRIDSTINAKITK
jgi:hypothetical protein